MSTRVRTAVAIVAALAATLAMSAPAHAWTPDELYKCISWKAAQIKKNHPVSEIWPVGAAGWKEATDYCVAKVKPS